MSDTETTTTTDLPGFDLPAGEAEEALARFRRDQVKRDGRVCACGHGMARHMDVDPWGDGHTRSVCRPVRMECPCEDPKPVVVAADTRPFLHKTKGAGAEHALTLGLSALAAKGKEWHWAEGWPRCELAGWPGAECTAAEGVRPYPVSARSMTLTDGPEASTFLLCLAHAAAVKEQGLPQ